MQVALLERLCTAARDDLSLGLLSPTQARQLVRLPAGNQVDALSVARRESLNGDELRGVIDLLLASGTSEKKAFVLEKPRLALEQAAGLVARSELAACDAAILRPSFENVIRQSTQVTALTTDFLRACFPDWETETKTETKTKTKTPPKEKSA